MPQLVPRRKLEQILNDIPVTSLSTLGKRQQLCDYIGHSLSPDIRTHVWDLSVMNQEAFAVTGRVSSLFGLKRLVKAGEKLGDPCDVSRVTTLPDPRLDDNHLGLVICPQSPIYLSWDKNEQLDAAIYGEPLYILQRDHDHSLIQSPNGYIGWVQNVDYRRIHQNEWAVNLKSNRAFFVTDYHDSGVFIPRGVELPVFPTGEVLLPTGSKIPLPNSGVVCSSLSQSHQRGALTTVARSLVGTPYRWGGIDPGGIDCSGFTYFVYRNIGIFIPRDTDQQILMGKICAIPSNRDALIPGDLLFFEGEYGGITHVAMAFGPDEFIHADTQQGVWITWMENEPQLQERFVLAKRVIR